MAITEPQELNPPTSTRRSVTMTEDAWEQLGYGAYIAVPSSDELLRDFYLMQSFDPAAGAVTTIIKRMVVSHIGEYVHDDEQMAEWVNAQLDNIEGGIKKAVGRLLSATWAGVAVMRKQWLLTGSEWGIKSLDLLHPLTFCPTLYGYNYSAEQYEAGGGIQLDATTQKVEQIVQFNGERWEKPVAIPIEECVYWPYAQEFREDTYGRSLFRRARRSWYVKTKVEEYWSIWCEKYAASWPIIKFPESFVTDATTGEVKDTATYGRDFLDKLRVGRGLSFAGGPDDHIEVVMVEPGAQDTGKDFQAACNYWDSKEYVACLFPQMLLTEPQHGSRAQAQTMLEFFLLLLDGITDELDDVILEQIVQPLIYYNFGEQEDYGRWEWDSLTDTDKDALAAQFAQVGRTLSGFTQAGYTMPDVDEERVREAFPEFLAPLSEVTPDMQQAVAAQAAQDAKQKLADEHLQAAKEGGMWQQAQVARRYAE